MNLFSFQRIAASPLTTHFFAPLSSCTIMINESVGEDVIGV